MGFSDSLWALGYICCIVIAESASLIALWNGEPYGVLVNTAILFAVFYGTLLVCVGVLTEHFKAVRDALPPKIYMACEVAFLIAILTVVILGLTVEADLVIEIPAGIAVGTVLIARMLQTGLLPRTDVLPKEPSE